jgi:hypothetical protein
LVQPSAAGARRTPDRGIRAEDQGGAKARWPRCPRAARAKPLEKQRANGEGEHATQASVIEGLDDSRAEPNAMFTLRPRVGANREMGFRSGSAGAPQQLSPLHRHLSRAQTKHDGAASARRNGAHASALWPILEPPLIPPRSPQLQAQPAIVTVTILVPRASIQPVWLQTNTELSSACPILPT